MRIDTLLQACPGKSSAGALGLSNAAIIRDKDQVILFDTGSHGVKFKLLESLAALGVALGDVKTVFLSHLHYDHCNNLTLFPDAELIVSEREWRYAHDVCDVWTPPETLSYLKGRIIRFIREEGETIAPGMKALFTPGHTPGHISLLLETDDGPCVLASDAAKNRAELSSGRSDQFENEAESAQSLAKIKAVAKRVLPGHDTWLAVENGTVRALQDVQLVIRMPEGFVGAEKDSYTIAIHP